MLILKSVFLYLAPEIHIGGTHDLYPVYLIRIVQDSKLFDHIARIGNSSNKGLTLYNCIICIDYNES